MFAQQLNKLTGETEWIEQTSEGEQIKEFIQHSQYLDMINDNFRNWAYFQAINQVIQSSDKVLDIGTGTGLLAIMAAKAIRDKQKSDAKNQETLIAYKINKTKNKSKYMHALQEGENYDIQKQQQFKQIQSNEDFSKQEKQYNQELLFAQQIRDDTSSDNDTFQYSQTSIRSLDYNNQKKQQFQQNQNQNDEDSFKQVVACEVFPPMFELSKKIIQLNGFENLIQVEGVRSDELNLQNEIQKFDAIVMEIFDSELLGEGVLITMEHAVKKLLKKGGQVIPHKGIVFGQIVQCEQLYNSRNINLIRDLWLNNLAGKNLQTETSLNQSNDEKNFNKNREFENFGQNFEGQREKFYALHVDNLFPENLLPISKPLKLFEFNFEKCDENCFKQSQQFEFEIENQGFAHAIILWWDLIMEKNSNLKISTKPKWIENSDQDQFFGDIQIPKQEWKNHWSQIWSVPSDFLNSNEQKFPGEKISLQIEHDETSFFVTSLVNNNQLQNCLDHNKIFLSYQINQILNSYFKPQRFSQFFDHNQIQQFDKSVEKINSSSINQNSSLFGLFTGINPIAIIRCIFKLPKESRIYIVNESTEFCTVLKKLFQFYNVDNYNENILIIFWDQIDRDDFSEKFDFVLSEPSYRDCENQSPWFQLRFWHRISNLKSRGYIHEKTQIFPQKGFLNCVGIKLPDFFRTQQKAGEIFGVDLALMNDYLNSNQNIIFNGAIWQLSENYVEVTEKSSLFQFDFNCNWEKDLENKIKLHWLEQDCNNFEFLLFWMDYQFEDVNKYDINRICLQQKLMSSPNVGLLKINKDVNKMDDQGIGVDAVLQRRDGELIVQVQ